MSYTISLKMVACIFIERQDLKNGMILGRLHRKQRKRLLAEERKRQHQSFGPRPKYLQSSQPRGIAEAANVITAAAAAQTGAGEASDTAESIHSLTVVEMCCVTTDLHSQPRQVSVKSINSLANKHFDLQTL